MSFMLFMVKKPLHEPIWTITEKPSLDEPLQ